MPDLNSDALGIWEHLKPAIDKEIEQKTRGMVQRRKMKVTTAPSISTGTIGVTEAFGTTEMVIPFATNLISATVGDMVWVEFMYGATNAFASMFASADEKDWDVAGDLTVHGVLDVTQRRCYATLSSAGWYKVCTLNFGSNTTVIGGTGFAVDICVTTTFNNNPNDTHFVSLLVAYERYYFVDEKSVSRSVCIDKIRYVNEGNGNGHIDIHYSPSVRNLVAVDFVPHIRPDFQQYFVAESLQSVADSPSGETVLTEYTFAANTITDISSNFVINTAVSGLTGKVHAIYDASSGLVHLSFTAYTSSTTFGISTPIFTCTNSKYIPAVTALGNGMIRMNNGEWYPYEVGIGSNGTIVQFLTGTATRVYGQITYPV